MIMKRGVLVVVFVCLAALISALSGCATYRVQADRGAGAIGPGDWPAGMSLRELKAQYERDLFEDFLPFMDKYVVDHEFGGFMCNTDRDGTKLSTRKSATETGRGIWVYSFLYRNLDPDPRYLEIARRSVDFLLKHRPTGDKFWPSSFTREGRPLDSPGSLYGDLYVAMGLTEYAKATGDETYWNISKDVIVKCMKDYDRPDHDFRVTYFKPDAPPIAGPRVLGHWMTFLWLSTQMLEFKSDPDVARIADRSVAAVMQHHYNPEFKLINEVLNHNLSRNEAYEQFVYPGTAIEVLWMVLQDALRRQDRELFDLAAERFRRHVEVAWDDVYGGAFLSLPDVDQNLWDTRQKALFLQEEMLIGCMLVIEHTGAQWAKDWFDKVYRYVRDTYPLRRHGLPLWTLYADRKVTFKRHYSRIGNFHHPRHLMLNLLALNRLIEGERSGRFHREKAPPPAAAARGVDKPVTVDNDVDGPEGLPKANFAWKALIANPGLVFKTVTKEDIRKMVALTHEMGFDAVVPQIMDSHKRGGRCWHTSKILKRADNVDFDMLEETIKEAKKVNLQVYGWYLNLCGRGVESLVKEHPEYYQVVKPWEEVQVGTPRTDPDRGNIHRGPWLCLDRGLTEYERTLLEEIVRGYDIDGLYIDYIGYRNYYACFCDYSNRKRTEFAKAHPELTEKEVMREFSEQAILRYTRQFREVMTSIKPHLKIASHIYPDFDLNLEYGNKMPIEYRGQSLGWWYTPYWSYEKTRDMCRYYKKTEGRYVKYNEVTALFGIGQGPKSPERIRKELRVISASGIKNITVMYYQTLLDRPELIKVMTEELK